MKKFHADGTYQLAERGTVYCGPAPAEFERVDALAAFDGPWEIDQPDAAGRVWRVVGVESHCVPTIRAGSPIGLLVEPWGQPNVK
jgi:hypothetical protein